MPFEYSSHYGFRAGEFTISKLFVSASFPNKKLNMKKLFLLKVKWKKLTEIKKFGFLYSKYISQSSKLQKEVSALKSLQSGLSDKNNDITGLLKHKKFGVSYIIPPKLGATSRCPKLLFLDLNSTNE